MFHFDESLFIVMPRAKAISCAKKVKGDEF
jgi:hypothetical protein